MDAVGEAGRHRFQHPPAVDRKDSLDHRIDADQQRKQRRNLRVAGQQQDRQLGEEEAEEVGPAVAEEDQTGGEVPDEKAEHGADARQRQQRDQAIVDLEADIGQAGQHQDRAHRGQAVEAIDDVDRVGDAGDREHRDQRRTCDHADQPVQPWNAGARDGGVEQPDRQCGRKGDGQQPPARADVLGEILDQAGHKGRQAAQHQRQRGQAGLRVEPDQEASGREHADQDADTTHPRHRVGVEFLRPRCVDVERQLAPAVRSPHEQQHDARGDCEGEEQDDHGRSLLSRRDHPGARATDRYNARSARPLAAARSLPAGETCHRRLSS